MVAGQQWLSTRRFANGGIKWSDQERGKIRADMRKDDGASSTRHCTSGRRIHVRKSETMHKPCSACIMRISHADLSSEGTFLTASLLLHPSIPMHAFRFFVPLLSCLASTPSNDDSSSPAYEVHILCLSNGTGKLWDGRFYKPLFSLLSRCVPRHILDLRRAHASSPCASDPPRLPAMPVLG